MNRIVSVLFVFIIVIGSIQCVSLDCEKQYIESIDQSIKDSTIDFLTIPLQFSDYNIVETANGDKILIEEFGEIKTPGKPQLPQKIISIAIPLNAMPTKISYEILQHEELPESYDIIPASIPTCINNTIIRNHFLTEYAQNYNVIYTKDIKYPKENINFLRSSQYRNYHLLDFEIYPFSYNPLSKKLSYCSEASITIEYQIEPDEVVLKNKEQTNIESIAEDIIYNYDQTHQWYGSYKPLRQDMYDFVIITLDSLTDAIEPLVLWETEKGNMVKVVTISWIDEMYQGYDLCEKIRNFLRDKYPNDAWGIEDVLIIGHWDDIPMRKTYQSMGMMDDENMPETDFYYAELSLPDSESWDIDQDHKYAENADPIDFYAEVSVGRIPWSDVETVQHICQKSIAFEQNTDPSFKNNILLLANLVDANTDGATFMEYCVNPDIHPWMQDWMKTRLYDRDSSYQKDYVLNHANVVSVWSSGTFGIVSWHSHGNPYGSGNFISVDDCQYLNDEYPSIISAASCSNSDTNYPNIGQAMMKQGAIGFLGANKATPYRTEWDDPLDGSDQSFKYYFISATTSGDKTQGQAHQYAISEMYQKNLWYDLKYETFVHGTLFGNPNLGISSPFENEAPETPEKPEGPNSGKIKQKQMFSTISTDPDGDQLYYGWSWGKDSIEWFGPFDSGEEITVEHTWIEEGTFNVKVKAKDIYGTESDWSDPLSVSMPRISIRNSFALFLERLFQRYFQYF